MRLLRPNHIQPKLSISNPDDEYEREADRVADQVMRMPDSHVPVNHTAPRISRKCDSCEKEEENIIQAKSNPNVSASLPSVSPVVLQTGGMPLDEPVRRSMETRFQRDFSAVRIHNDGGAARSAAGLNALAYTAGAHIVFGAGQYRPHTSEGAKLLAHELTHVVQQQGSTPWSPGVETIEGGGQRVRVLPPLGERGDSYEREADVMPKRDGSFQQTRSSSLQRIELPTPLPICGTMVTDVDILSARPRPLVECGLPPTVMVRRINIVGRRRTAASTGHGRIIFNLHIGYYTDPTTGRICLVVSDSERCLTPGGCIHLGCFPTLAEILDAILKFLLAVLGIILFILLVRFLRGIRLSPPMEAPPVIAGGPEPERENIPV